jgi:hypothetical protein
MTEDVTYGGSFRDNGFARWSGRNELVDAEVVVIDAVRRMPMHWHPARPCLPTSWDHPSQPHACSLALVVCWPAHGLLRRAALGGLRRRPVNNSGRLPPPPARLFTGRPREQLAAARPGARAPI